jgi:hypothetical protein
MKSVFRKPLLLLLMLIARSASVPAADPPPAMPSAIVQVGGCSGVCVDSSGLILTARHCDLGEVERVRFANYEVVAVRVYEAGETEGPVVYDCVGEGFPALKVADHKPDIGEAVSSAGYPDYYGSRKLTRVTGRVETGGLYRFRGGEFKGNLTNLPLHEGWSGGPLLNAAGEVVGLATSSDGVESIFISHAATRRAYEAAAKLVHTRVPLEITLDLYHPESLRFLADYSNNTHLRLELQEHYEIRVVGMEGTVVPAGTASVAELPVFRVNGEVVATGYVDKVDLLERLVPRIPPSQEAMK